MPRKFDGQCIVCGRPTYDDGEGADPRGPLGLSASTPLVAADYDMVGADVPLDFGCMQVRERYEKAVKRAKQLWRTVAKE